MDTHKNNPTLEAEADLQAILDHLTSGRPLDLAAAHRVRERSEKATQEIREKFGVLNVAVDLIREIRDEE